MSHDILKCVLKNGELYVYDNHGLTLVHNNHSIPTTKHEFEEDVFNHYVVWENCTNYPLIHGVSAISAHDALEEIADIDDVDPQDLIGVNRIELVTEDEPEEEDDGTWVDPAGGIHYEDEDDPARMYE